MEDLCGGVCQPLRASVKFLWVDDRKSFILVKRGLSSGGFAIPNAEKTLSVKQIIFSYFHLCSLSDLFNTHTWFLKKYRVNGKYFVFEKYPILFLPFLRGRTILKWHETTTEDTFPCWKTKSRINAQQQYWKVREKRERSKVDKSITTKVLGRVSVFWPLLS